MLAPSRVSILEAMVLATPILIASQTKLIKREMADQALMRLIVHHKGMLRECRSFTFFPLTINLSGGDSSVEANVHIHGDYSGNTGSDNIFHSNNVYNYYGTDLADPVAQILRCLYKGSYRSHRSRVREPAKGTCTWVTEHQRYKDWSKK